MLTLRRATLVLTAAVLFAGCPSNPSGNDDAATGDAAPTGDAPPVGEGGTEQDPCGALTQGGTCSGDTGFDYCDVPSERGGRRHQAHTSCAQGERCMVQNGRATCALTADCRDGDTECSAASELRTCASSAWTTRQCDNGCVTTGTGAACAPPMTMGMLRGRVNYDFRTANTGYTDWNAPTQQPLRSATVIVYRGSMVVASSSTSATDGTFSVRVPDTIMAGDKITVVASALRSDQRNVGWVIVDPHLAAGANVNTGSTDDVSNGTPWSWSWNLDELPAGDANLTIAEADGSGAASVFDWFGNAWREATTRYMEPPSIVIWMGNNVAWQCGACVNSSERRIFNQRFPQQMWYIMDGDRSYYARATIGHESGHWLTNAFSTNPGEGGDHQSNCPSMPGLAWNEGIATWFGQVLLDSPVYYDRYPDGFLWTDFSMRTSSATPWRRPSTSAPDVLPTRDSGTLQRLPEADVTAMLWALSNRRADAAAIYQAIAAPRFRDPVMINGNQGWERGYRTHTWDGTGDNCAVNRPVATNDTAPVFPDFLDALVCAGFARDRVRAAVGTDTFYPYNPDTAFCR